MALILIVIGSIIVVGVATMLLVYSDDTIASECTQDCDQGRKCTCRLTPEEIRRKFEEECG